MLVMPPGGGSQKSACWVSLSPLSSPVVSVSPVGADVVVGVSPVMVAEVGGRVSGGGGRCVPGAGDHTRVGARVHVGGRLGAAVSASGEPSEEEQSRGWAAACEVPRSGGCGRGRVDPGTSAARSLAPAIERGGRAHQGRDVGPSAGQAMDSFAGRCDRREVHDPGTLKRTRWARIEVDVALAGRVTQVRRSDDRTARRRPRRTHQVSHACTPRALHRHHGR